MEQLKVGQLINNFKVLKVKKILEFNLTAYILKHKSKASLLHISRKDSNNVFACAFKTPPSNSKGIPHILEHTVLCGSEKYPVRDPFFKMLNRSMANYMNAWTCSDFTCYPFSTTDHEDMENLRDVYFDAVFFPTLSKFDFAQEGWRLENHTPDDNSSPLEFKGVVYNEMKGAFSDMENLFSTRLQQLMYPGTTYSQVSGGDPREITNLKYEELVEFHRSYYNPSNAYFMTYGDYPIEKHLKYLDGRLTQGNVEIKSTPSFIPTENGIKRKVISGISDSSLGERGSRIALSFLTNDSKDLNECFALEILSRLLLSGQSSPMYKALIESNLASGFIASGYDNSTKISSFTFGAQGVRKSDLELVERTIKSVLKSVQDFDQSRVDSILHEIELSVKHKSAKFGMNLVHPILSSWIHDADPIDSLEINKKMNWFKEEYQKGSFFESRIEKYFLNNKHCVVLIMNPDEQYSDSMSSEENSRLDNTVSSLSMADKEKIYSEAQQLAALQSKIQDVSCLPMLSLNNILRPNAIEIRKKNIRGVSVQFRETETNEITYLDVLASVQVPHHLQEYFPLFASSLTNLGTKTLSPSEFDQTIRGYTGGIGVNASVMTSYHDLYDLNQGILLSSSSLNRNVSQMQDLILQALNEVKYNNLPALETLINRLAMKYANSIADNGHILARSYASSTLSPSKKINENHGGITQVRFLNKLQKKSVKEISEVMIEINDIIQQKSQIQLRVNHEPGFHISLEKFIMGLPSTNGPSKILNSEFKAIRGIKKWITLPLNTGFASKAIDCVTYDHEDSPKLQLLSSILSHHFLHRQIREKNGAYGGGASYSPMDGIFSFYSYRDPNPEKSVETFDEAIHWLRDYSITESQLHEAKLSILKGLDAPISAKSEGLDIFLGLPQDVKLNRREKLLAVTNLNDVIEKYLLKDGNSVVLSGENPTSSKWETELL